MNYYEHHLGDYAKDTGHLSMLEHGAYRLLLDRYYSTEEGIPAAQAHRLARARSDEERQAVDVVLDEFFELIEGVWINRRAEEEIAAARVRIDAARANGKKGGRPKKEGKPLETQEKPSGFSVGSKMETQPKAHQAPSTNLQLTPTSGVNDLTGDAREELGGASPRPVDPIHSRACAITALLRPRGCTLQASNPNVRAWAERGVTDAQLLTALDIADQRRAEAADPSPINAGFLNSILSDVLTKPARASPGRITREESRAIAASTRLSDYRRAVAMDEGQTDDRTIEALPASGPLD